ncbi:hypothetical protein [Cryobacterium sp. 10C3]|uniref:hypothetical protein n=1 Tax=Cryobacterium sp. 10C3 TaxID=3048577 RepID=UPI002AB3EADF|nr:hypothetical protein [Cryobacterium sp. 10C3]MDY7556151.1 hypothetical protein [Cryobacterium sp. 10C3]
MRFLFAIVALVLAGVMIVLGIAQRTVFLEPATSSLSATIAADAPYAVIDSSALTEHPGAQTVTLSGSDTLFAAYGRTADVKAWLAGHEYVSIHSTDKNGPGLGSDTVPADTDVPAGTAPVAAATVTNPAGSDLWLEEFTGTKELTATVNLPEGISMIVASDGTNPAPSKVSITWPVDNSTPWAGPLIMGAPSSPLSGSSCTCGHSSTCAGRTALAATCPRVHGCRDFRARPAPSPSRRARSPGDGRSGGP